MNAQPTIKQDETSPVGPEILAQAIVDVSKAAKQLLASRLSKRAICLLIKDSIGHGPGLKDIQLVLDHAAGLEATYLNKRKP